MVGSSATLTRKVLGATPEFKRYDQLMKKYSEQIIGVLQEAVFLVLAAILYNTVLIEFVREGKYLFLGSGYWFIFEILIFPVINVILRKHKRLIGNIGGVIVYFFLFLPLAMLFGGA